MNNIDFFYFQFLNELSKNSDITKMTPFNIAIVLGPTLLWSQTATSISEQSNLDRIISVVTTLIDNYKSIFPIDFDWSQFEEEDLKQVRFCIKLTANSVVILPSLPINYKIIDHETVLRTKEILSYKD